MQITQGLRTSVLCGVRSTVQNIELHTGSTEDIMSHIQRSEDVGLESSFAPFEKRTLTDVEVAARLGVSRFTVRSWRLKGTGPRFLKMGRAVRYRPEDVDEYERQALVDTHDHSGRTPV
jgi:excisionase family DNA binding protein